MKQIVFPVMGTEELLKHLSAKRLAHAKNKAKREKLRVAHHGLHFCYSLDNNGQGTNTIQSI